MTESPDVLLTGATGYVGGRLLGELEQAGHAVRCLARRPEYLIPRVGPRSRVLGGDVLRPETLPQAFAGIHTAIFLIHAMGTTGSFEEEEKTAALNFVRAAEQAGVRKIIYLGGLSDEREELSPHLRSRHRTGEILRSSSVPAIEFRASVVIGSGSLSFEMIRSLVQKLPVMTTPTWVRVQAQPIAMSDLLAYLMAALEQDITESHVFEIGGRDVVTYADLMREYALRRGLKRILIPVPVLTPRISSLWLGLVTPLYARVGRKLIDSIQHPSVVRDPSALEFFPIRPKGVREAIDEAMRKEDREFETTRWSDSLAAGGTDRQWGGVRFGSRVVDSRTRRVAVPAPQAFAPIRRIGGTTGWYFANGLWRLRGFIDLLAGGVGLRRGRLHPDELRVGDVVDWWRVEAYEPNKLVRFMAEMKVPGRAWLQFEVTEESGGSVIRQTAIFDPLGLPGLLYWYGIYPLHAMVFRGMLRRVARRAEETEGRTSRD